MKFSITAAVSAAFFAILLPSSPARAEVCQPEFITPIEGDTISLTPTIKARLQSELECKPNVKLITLEIAKLTDRGIPVVYEWTHNRGNPKVFKRRQYESGMTLVDHTVPERDRLEPGTSYQIQLTFNIPGQRESEEFIEVTTRHDYAHSIVIDGQGTTGGTVYTISGGGRLEQAEGMLEGYAVTIQGNDEVDGNRAEGRVGDGIDGFRVYGEIPVISLENPRNARVLVDGDQFHTVLIEGTGGGSDYTISGGGRLDQVSGTLHGYDVSIQSDDLVDGARAEGHVGSGNDGFQVYGPVPEVQLENPANAVVYIDGQQR